MTRGVEACIESTNDRQGAGLSQYIFNALSYRAIPIVPSTAPIPTAQAVVDALKRMPAEVLLLAPSVVAELAQSPELLEYCAEHLELIMYIGGDLPQATGDRVAARIPLRCQWGASEVGIPHQLIPAELGSMDWRYIRFHPCVGAMFDEVAEGIFELVIRRGGDHHASTQPTWAIQGIDGLDGEYRTRDLFERHPRVADAWCWRARADDIIVFLNGEKTNPVSMEQHIVASNPELSGAIVLGAQRFQAALLLEPASLAAPLTTAQQAALIERVWPSVQEANRAAPAHARIEKALILVATPDRPLLRAAKGTIQRAISIMQYTSDIDALYVRADLMQDNDLDGVPAAGTPEPMELAQVIRACVRSVTEWTALGDGEDFFASGMDSLQGLQLTRALRRSLFRPSLALSTVYHNPSVHQLTAALSEQAEPTEDRDAVEPLLAAYRQLVHQIPVPSSPRSVSHQENKGNGTLNIILTGSTGQVGTYMLRSLLARADVARVYCLNRAADGGRQVQFKRFAAAGLDTGALEARVSFTQVDVAQPLLGLEQQAYDSLRDAADLFIHNGWPVNFNLPLSAFRPQLAGVVHVLALAAAGGMRMMFVSSVSTVAGLPTAAGPAPERSVQGLDAPYGAGYALSKYAGERLCDAAAIHLDQPIAVIRLGQVAGAVHTPSTWSRAEWLPRLVVGSVGLGCVPDALGSRFSKVDFVPVDVLGEAMADIALSSPWRREGEGLDTGASYFNLRNPHPVAWKDLLPAVLDAAHKRVNKKLDVVSPSTWLARMRERETQATAMAAADGPVSTLPALALLEFYENLFSSSTEVQPPMAIEHALAVSPSLRNLPAVKLQWMRTWAEAWID